MTAAPQPRTRPAPKRQHSYRDLGPARIAPDGRHFFHPHSESMAGQWVTWYDPTTGETGCSCRALKESSTHFRQPCWHRRHSAFAALVHHEREQIETLAPDELTQDERVTLAESAGRHELRLVARLEAYRDERAARERLAAEVTATPLSLTHYRQARVSLAEANALLFGDQEGA